MKVRPCGARVCECGRRIGTRRYDRPYRTQCTRCEAYDRDRRRYVVEQELERRAIRGRRIKGETMRYESRADAIAAQQRKDLKRSLIVSRAERQRRHELDPAVQRYRHERALAAPRLAARARTVEVQARALMERLACSPGAFVVYGRSDDLLTA